MNDFSLFRERLVRLKLRRPEPGLESGSSFAGAILIGEAEIAVTGSPTVETPSRCETSHPTEAITQRRFAAWPEKKNRLDHQVAMPSGQRIEGS